MGETNKLATVMPRYVSVTLGTGAIAVTLTAGLGIALMVAWPLVLIAALVAIGYGILAIRTARRTLDRRLAAVGIGLGIAAIVVAAWFTLHVGDAPGGWSP